MTISSENVFDKIRNEYYDLTAAEKKTADFILENRGETQYMSISELADSSGVAEASVTRFCRRLGYKGYSAFKLAVANSTAQPSVLSPLSGSVRDEDSFEDMCQKIYSANMSAMTETLTLIDRRAMEKAADLLEQAGTVLCMGQGGSMILAREAAHLFSTAGGKYFFVEDSHMQAIATTSLKDNDVVFFFSYSGATVDMMHILRLARERGAKIILVTHFPKSPGAALADIVLQCGANESPLQLGSVAARIAQMFLVDILFSELCRRNLDACRDTRQRIADALSEKHL